MPCSPHPLEVLDTQVQSALRMDEACRAQWAELVEHVGFVLGVVSLHPDQGLAEAAVVVPLPDPLAGVPDLSEAEMGAYGAGLRAWLAVAQPTVHGLEARLCHLRTLAIRLGDAVEAWPDQQRGMRLWVLDAHRRHRLTDRQVWCANLRWALARSQGLPAAAGFTAELAQYEAMDEFALLRLLEVP